MARMRSPNYPAMPLEDALKGAKTLWDKNRVATISREAAAKDLGYTGLTGRSLQVLGALNQYGLTENVAKGHMRVTKVGESALIGFPEEVKRRAITEAARSPSFFRDILERFEGSVPGDNAVRFFLLSNGFTNDGVEKALKVFADTTRFVEINGDSESYGKGAADVANSVEDDEQDAATMNMSTQAVDLRPAPPPPPADQALRVNFDVKSVELSGRTTSPEELNNFIKALVAVQELFESLAPKERPGASNDEG